MNDNDMTKTMFYRVRVSAGGEYLAETLAGIFCMAYRNAAQGGELGTDCEIAGQSAVEAFLETLTR